MKDLLLSLLLCAAWGAFLAFCLDAPLVAELLMALVGGAVISAATSFR